MNADTLIALGLALFFAGLMSGNLILVSEFVAPILKNNRMGLTSHVEGTANGTFLVLVGLIWNRCELTGIWEPVAFWSLVYGAWANWGATQLAAIWGTGKMSPIASGDRIGKPLHETIVNTMLVTVGIGYVIGVPILFVGILR